MGTYKVLQDIEAEDKLLGPLSLRQFVYAIIVVVSLFTAFKLVTSSGGRWYLALPLLPIIVFFALLAAPFGHDQPNEVWLLGKISFALKPRKRIWNQSGIKELVTITAPVVIEKHLTKELSQTEVHSRLQALANTIDSRGWVIKNVDNPYAHPAVPTVQPVTDRLVGVDQTVLEDPDKHFDVLDYYDNPTIGNVDQLISNAQQERQQKLESIMQRGQTVSSGEPTKDAQWFAQNIDGGTPVQSTYTQPDVSSTEQVVTPPAIPQPVTTTVPIEQNYAQVPIVQPQSQPISNTNVSPATDSPSQQNPQSTSVTEVDPAIINLANNDDLNIATIARQANKVSVQTSDNEVVISLH